MADSINLDFSELTRLAADLGKVPDTAGPFLRSAIEFTSVEVKEAAQKTAGSGNRRWKPLPAGIDYEVTVDAGVGGSSLTSEIGYDKDRTDVAKLGNIREYGSSRVAPHNDLLNALHKNEADFQKGLEKALRDAEREAGI